MNWIRTAARSAACVVIAAAPVLASALASAFAADALPASTTTTGHEAGTGWVVDRADNICGLDDPNDAVLRSLDARAAALKKTGQDLSGLPHVEVRLPGGWLAGRLVGREGNIVTIVTDYGIRMVIETDEVRPITARRTRVLGTVEKLGGFTGKPVEASKKP